MVHFAEHRTGNNLL